MDMDVVVKYTAINCTALQVIHRVYIVSENKVYEYIHVINIMTEINICVSERNLT